MTFADLLVSESFSILVVFARLGAALMLLPGFGESHVNPRLRLWLALFASAVVATVLGERLPRLPQESATFVAMVGGEVLIGLAIGAIVRLALAALHVAGSIIAMQSGLAAAAFFDPSEASQGTVTGALLSTTFLALVFTSDTHHLLFARIVAGYGALPAGVPPPMGDLLTLAVGLGDAAIGVGMAVAAPVVIAAFLGNLAVGLLARIVPALQVLFVALPVQLVLALSVMAMAFGGGVVAALRFLDQTSAWLGG